MKFCFVQKEFVDANIDRDKLAVIGDDFELTWKEFKNRVDTLCDEFIQNSHEKLKFPVIIYGHKSANMIVAIYAMIKLEIAYIPLDMIYPYERRSKIVKISESQFIINTTDAAIDFENVSELMMSGSDLSYKRKMITSEKAEVINDPLVYIIFTSGSTGEPKGVQISTEAVQSFVRWMTTDFGFSADDVFINSAILSFDLSVFEVMTFAGIGGTILLNSKDDTSDPNLFLDRIQKYNGTIWVSTPSYALVYSRIGVESKLDSINTFLFCGEVLPHGLAKKLKENFKQARVINTYGPTEATVATTLIEISEQILKDFDPLPVGKAKRESELLIENDEIIIIGPNVSVGYFKNPKLNEVKFKLINKQRAFKTGDKGFLQNGMLFFSGRNDDLVKLHGYRIELNEITGELNNLNYILQAETIALKRNGVVKKIVSLVQKNTRISESINSERIKKDLARVIPHYMVPSDVKIVDIIPLNQNGKADKTILTQIYLQK